MESCPSTDGGKQHVWTMYYGCGTRGMGVGITREGNARDPVRPLGQSPCPGPMDGTPWPYPDIKPQGGHRRGPEAGPPIAEPLAGATPRNPVVQPLGQPRPLGIVPRLAPLYRWDPQAESARGTPMWNPYPQPFGGTPRPGPLRAGRLGGAPGWNPLGRSPGWDPEGGTPARGKG